MMPLQAEPSPEWQVRPLCVYAAQRNKFDLITDLTDKHEIIAAADRQLQLTEHGWGQMHIRHTGPASLASVETRTSVDPMTFVAWFLNLFDDRFDVRANGEWLRGLRMWLVWK